MISKRTTVFTWGGTHPFFYHPLVSHFMPDLKNKKIVDCGCGKGIYGFLMRATRDLKGATLTGIDINPKNLKFCKMHNIYDRLIKTRLPLLPFKDKSIDFLMCTEVIEHLTKKEGLKLISEIDRVVVGRSIITTPNVFFETNPGIFEDAHHSLWKPRDFRKYDYKVYGLGAATPIKFEDKILKIKSALHYLFTPISYLIPEIGGYLICVKEQK